MRTNQTPQVFERSVPRPVRVRYLLFLPSGYEEPSSKPWPLMLFLHGSGERGRQLHKVAAHGPPLIVKTQPVFPFIVVSPQCAAGDYWSNSTLLPLLDDLEERYRVDKSRVYLTGLSMGGYGTWELAMTQPDRFAAIAPICGGGNTLPILLSDRSRERFLKTLGVWAFHGAKDPVVPLAESQRMIAAIREIGNHAKLTVYPEAGHDAWTETYQNPALYRWLLEHKRRR